MRVFVVYMSPALWGRRTESWASRWINCMCQRAALHAKLRILDRIEIYCAGHLAICASLAHETHETAVASSYRNQLQLNSTPEGFPDAASAGVHEAADHLIAGHNWKFMLLARWRKVERAPTLGVAPDWTRSSHHTTRVFGGGRICYMSRAIAWNNEGNACPQEFTFRHNQSINRCTNTDLSAPSFCEWDFYFPSRK